MPATHYIFDPPADISIKDLADLFKTFMVAVDHKLYQEAPPNVKRMFKPSILGPSPSKMLN